MPPNNWAHAPQPLGLSSRARQPGHLQPVSTRRPLQWEAHAPQLESSPHSPQLKKSPSSNDDLAQSKAINFFKKLSKSYYRASLILIRKYQNKEHKSKNLQTYLLNKWQWPYVCVHTVPCPATPATLLAPQG